MRAWVYRGERRETVLPLVGVGASATAAALGFGKAGMCWVAAEPSFPGTRLEQIAADAQATLGMTDSAHLRLAHDLAGGRRRVVVDLDDFGAAADAEPAVRTGLDEIATLIYTSGSTGQPKAVVQTRRSAVAHAARYANALRIGNADRVASFGSLAWAGPLWDTFGPLCPGGSVGLYEVRRWRLHALPAWLKRTHAAVDRARTGPVMGTAQSKRPAILPASKRVVPRRRPGYRRRRGIQLGARADAPARS